MSISYDYGFLCWRIDIYLPKNQYKYTTFLPTNIIFNL